MSKNSATEWKKFIKEFENSDTMVTFEFTDPMNVSSIVNNIYITLKSNLSIELHSFYQQTNGIKIKYNDVYIGELVWPLEKVLQQNVQIRSGADYRAQFVNFENLLFFSSSEEGSLFGISILNENSVKPDVYGWSEAQDRRYWVSQSVKDFIETRIKIKLESIKRH